MYSTNFDNRVRRRNSCVFRIKVSRWLAVRFRLGTDPNTSRVNRNGLLSIPEQLYHLGILDVIILGLEMEYYNALLKSYSWNALDHQSREHIQLSIYILRF